MAKRKINRWPELCRLVEADDGLPSREVGLWTEDKLWFWNGYIDIATNGMHKKWPDKLVYVDLFAGPGVCRIRDSNWRIPGSVLIAANAPQPFCQIIACELNKDTAAACEARLARSPAAGKYHIFVGDCNACINDVVQLIPANAFTLAFIDPPGLNAHFTTVRALAARGKVDLLILFADAMDALRNIGIYTAQAESNLDLVLGAESNWRLRREELNNCNAAEFRRLLATIYIEQLQRLGYCVFGEKVMKAQHGPLYRLVFASKHSRGLEFWDKVTKSERGGQKGLF